MNSNLNCQAHNCAYNKSNNCYASYIKVEGFDATVTPETYCESFRHKGDYNLSNDVSEESLTNTQNISCTAKNCSYNRQGACNASHVDINYQNTNCETFRLAH